MFEAIATIETERLTLKPFSDKFLTDRYVGWLNDETVMAHSRHRHRSQTLESCRQFAEEMKIAGHYFWAITTKDELGHIGNICAYTNFSERSADLTILIGETRSWGHGFGAEAWIAVIDWLFAETDVTTITAGTIAANKGMVGIMEKAGMATELKKNHTLSDGDVADTVFGTKVKE